jgi:hypothetical protein
VKKSFNIQELLALQVQTSWNRAHARLLIKSWPKTSKGQDLKHPGSVDLKTKQNKTKQNKLPSFIDRLIGVLYAICLFSHINLVTKYCGNLVLYHL